MADTMHRLPPGIAPPEPGRRYGFFTDTSICIGCKACEVACKEWNGVPDRPLSFTGESYDNTGKLGADTWRHVAFIEQPGGSARSGSSSSAHPEVLGSIEGPCAPDAPQKIWGASSPGGGAATGSADTPSSGSASTMDFKWLMSSDVCKHCTDAACLAVCPTGSLFRTEFGTVVVQEDICNGCGYCVPACPFGVIDRRENDGRAWKCTLCYDRLKGGLAPACATACPTQSIQFGPLDELRERAAGRVTELQGRGIELAQLYGESPDDGVGGFGAFFLLLDDPEVYGMPPDPVDPTRDLGSMWRAAGAAAVGLAAAAVASMVGGRR